MRFSERLSEQKIKNSKGPHFTLVTCNSHDLTDKPEADGTLIFFFLLYAISTFRLFINENSCSRNANALYVFFFHYGPQVKKFEPAPIIRPIFFVLLVTVLTGFHCTCFSSFSGSEI